MRCRDVLELYNLLGRSSENMSLYLARKYSLNFVASESVIVNKSLEMAFLSFESEDIVKTNYYKVDMQCESGSVILYKTRSFRQIDGTD